MLFLGIDQSLTRLGIALIDDGVNAPRYLGTVVPGDRREGKRLSFIASTLEKILEGHHITQAAMEGYSIGSLNRPFDLGEVGGLVKRLLYDLSIPLVVAAPTQLKKFVTGSGAAGKDTVQAAVLRKWEVATSFDDEADAYGLAKLAACYHTGTSIYREELEVIHSLKKPDNTALKSRVGRTRNTL